MSIQPNFVGGQCDDPLEQLRARSLTPPPAEKRRARLLEDTSAKRKMYPITTGLLDYFPDACAEVAMVSYLGNEKHNPGEPLHWSRGKSMDHPDCIARHLIERGGFDEKIRHSAALAWRAMANLQEELEVAYGLAPPRGAKDAVTVAVTTKVN